MSAIFFVCFTLFLLWRGRESNQGKKRRLSNNTDPNGQEKKKNQPEKKHLFSVAGK